VSERGGGGPREPESVSARTLRDLWSETQEEVLGRPIVRRATRLTRQTLAWFPIRVWRHFLQHNGFLLAAGISYQSLFAIFGVFYLSFAAVGLWLGGSKSAVDGMIRLINRYIPGIIGEHGLVTPKQVEALVQESGSLLTVTGLVAVVVTIWTAIGFVTYTRRAVRDTFGLPFDRRSYVLLKARDFVAALFFGAALLTGALLSYMTIGAVDWLLDVLGAPRHSFWFRLLAQVVSGLVAFALNAAALAGLFRFLTGTSMRWRRILPGALLGAVAMVALQIGAGFLFVYTPTNPLLATFAVFVGFLLWFRLNGIVILVAGAWIAVAAADHGERLQSAADLEAMERAAVLLASEVRVREARRALHAARWFQRPSARRRVRDAESDLRAARAAAPPALRDPWPID
jgi:membrane protein